MRKLIPVGVFLIGILTAGLPLARAQEAPNHSPRFQWSSSDLAVTYTTEQGSVTPPGAGNFWLQGFSIDAAGTFFHGLGLAGNVTADYASQIAPGVSLGKVAYMFGPRYTYRLRTGSTREARLFGEVLAGGVKGFDSVFPVVSGVSKSATAFSGMAGGGIDIAISKHFAIRAIEADYVRTYLPNNGTNVQEQLRLAFGVTYHIGEQRK